MIQPIITVVAGPSGSGKTTWICQQTRLIASSQKNVLYFSPGSGIPIDQSHIATEFPTVKVFSDGQEVEFLNQLAAADAVYIELGFYLELEVIAQILDNLPYHAIAVIPPHLKDSEWHSWATEIVPGAAAQTSLAQAHLWRASSTGQVIEENSLEDFWYEMTHCAYGSVARVKGIFNVADGRSLYADFVAGVAESDFVELNLPRHLEGRQERFSGLEVLGENLDEASLRQTLLDCCLSEAAILYYQEQAKQLLIEEK